MNQACAQTLFTLCREDIESADQAVAAVAHLLHQVVPDGDVSAAVQKLAQVNCLLDALFALCSHYTHQHAAHLLHSKALAFTGMAANEGPHSLSHATT